MASMANDLSLLSEFLAKPDANPRTVSLWNKLNEAYKRDPNSARVQVLLNQYIQSIGASVAGACSAYVVGTQFDGLSNSGKATVIRDVMGSGVRVGFGLTASMSQVVYSSMFRDAGLGVRPVGGTLDEKRFNQVVKIAIGDSLDKEYVKASSFIRGSFSQVVETGYRETLLATGRRASDAGEELYYERTATSKKPCEVCVSMSGVRVPLDEGDSLFKFHDTCHCRMALVR